MRPDLENTKPCEPTHLGDSARRLCPATHLAKSCQSAPLVGPFRRWRRKDCVASIASSQKGGAIGQRIVAAVTTVARGERASENRKAYLGDEWGNGYSAIN